MAVTRSDPAPTARSWTFWPRIHEDLYAADHSLSFFWRRHVPMLVAFVVFTCLPFVRSWTGLSPSICALALLVHALVFGSEVHVRISRFIGLGGYTTLVLTTNFLAVAAICASPGRFVPFVWPLYFIYLVIPSVSGAFSAYVTLVAMAAPALAGMAWSWLGTSTWDDGAIQLAIVAVFAGFSYFLLATYAEKLREQRILIERERLNRAREEQKLAIADDLHDSLGIVLAEAALWHGIGQRTPGEDGRAALERAERRLQDAMKELRAAVATLGDQDISQAAIGDILRSRIESLCVAADIAFEMRCEGASGWLGGGRAHHLVKLAEEAVSNAIRHGKPTRLELHLSWEDGIRLVVSDDGRGFDPAAVRRGHGFSSLERRAALLGGELDIRSTVGEGTTVELRAR